MLLSQSKSGVVVASPARVGLLMRGARRRVLSSMVLRAGYRKIKGMASGFVEFRGKLSRVYTEDITGYIVL